MQLKQLSRRPRWHARYTRAIRKNEGVKCSPANCLGNRKLSQKHIINTPSCFLPLKIIIDFCLQSWPRSQYFSRSKSNGTQTCTSKVYVLAQGLFKHLTGVNQAHSLFHIHFSLYDLCSQVNEILSFLFLSFYLFWSIVPVPSAKSCSLHGKDQVS